MPFEGIQVKRTISARRERVFRAWTRPELMARWFFPGQGWTCEVSSDLRVGGHWQVSMRDAEGGQHHQFGEYREIVPETRLVFTWSCPDLGVQGSIVTVDLLEVNGATELTLTHELPPDPKVRSGHEEGWQGCLGNLEKYLQVAE
jgi:uncharacterized protein YndB with AHSA1/START domain